MRYHEFTQRKLGKHFEEIAKNGQKDFEEIAKNTEKNFEETAIPAILALSENISMEPERIFKRKIYDRLLQWKESSNGKSALLIEGARRIGKSTIVDAFARNEDYAQKESVKYIPAYLACFL